MGEDQNATPTASWYFRSEGHGSPHAQDVVGTAGRGRLLSSAPDPPITPSDRACGGRARRLLFTDMRGFSFLQASCAIPPAFGPAVRPPPRRASRGGASGCHCLPLGAWRGGTAGRRARGQTVVHGSFLTATRSCCAARRGSAPRPTHAPTAHCPSWWVQLEAPPPAGCAAAGTAVPPPFPSVVLSLAVPPPPLPLRACHRQLGSRRCTAPLRGLPGGSRGHALRHCGGGRQAGLPAGGGGLPRGRPTRQQVAVRGGL